MPRDERAVWSASDFGLAAVPKASQPALRAVAELPGYDHLAEVGAGLCATAAALAATHPSVEASDLPGRRLDEARRLFPDLDIRAEDAVTASARLVGRRTLFLAVNVLGNLPPDELRAFLANVRGGGSALFYKSRGAPPGSTGSKARRAIGYDHAFDEYLSEAGLVKRSGDRSFRNGRWIYCETWVAPSLASQVVTS